MAPTITHLAPLNKCAYTHARAPVCTQPVQVTSTRIDAALLALPGVMAMASSVTFLPPPNVTLLYTNVFDPPPSSTPGGEFVA